jgi:serine/threonine protein kinase
VLGRGKFGEVKVARELSSDFIVALKIMKKTDLEDNNYHTQTQREIAIQSSLNHPNILKLYGYFWDSTSVVLVLEYAPKGQLFSILKKTGKLS